jgi:hypothetical protein
MSPFQETMRLANSAPLWIFCLAVVGMVLIQTLIFVWISNLYAKKCGITRTQIAGAVRSGLISTIGPALSVFVVGLGLLAQIGAPLMLARLSVIGNAAYEASAAEMAAAAMNTRLGSDTYTIQAFTASVWVMNLGGICMLLPPLFLLKLLSRLTQTMTKKANLGMLLGLSASLASFGYFAADYARRSAPHSMAVAAGFVAMLVLESAAKRLHLRWLGEWALALSLLIAAVLASLVKQ